MDGFMVLERERESVCVCVHLERAELTIAAFEVFDLIQCAITDEFTSTQLYLFGCWGC